MYLTIFFFFTNNIVTNNIIIHPYWCSSNSISLALEVVGLALADAHNIGFGKMWQPLSPFPCFSSLQTPYSLDDHIYNAKVELDLGHPLENTLHLFSRLRQGVLVSNTNISLAVILPVWDEVVTPTQSQDMTINLHDLLLTSVARNDAVQPSHGGRGKRKAVQEVVVDRATQQKQRRMIKNRESAARSRERKQLMECLIPVEEKSKPRRMLRRVNSAQW
ncbi:hypothetical protein ACSQ67_013285 [Phaseolus vulgaris]